MDFATALGHSTTSRNSWSEEEFEALSSRVLWPRREDFEKGLAQNSPDVTDMFRRSKKRIQDTALAVAVSVVRQDVNVSTARLSAQWLSIALEGTALLNFDIAKAAADLLGEEWREKVKQSALGPGPELDKPSTSDLASAKELLEKYISDRELEEDEPGATQPSAPESSSAPSVDPMQTGSAEHKETSQENYGTEFLKLEELAKISAGAATTDSAHADIFTRLDNAMTAIAEVRSRAGRALKQTSLSTHLHASGQQADSVVTSYDHLAHQPSPNESCEVADLSYEAERVARSNRETDTQPSTRNALCVDCGQAWQEPSTNTLPSAFLCEFCNEGTRPAVTCCNYLDLWD